MDKNFLLNAENVLEDFSDHLRKVNNFRVLFSGKFGVGKTYFLEKYFSKSEADYNVFWINPINYVLGSNEDIFEWIKIDLAKQLVNNYFADQETKKTSDNFFIQAYIYTNATTLFNKLISIIGNQYVKSISSIDFLNVFTDKLKEYKKYKANLSKKIKTDSENLNDFLLESPHLQKTIYENDLTTSIISASIKKLKLDSNKTSVLIIDDLDRMDPEHIFRLLNIFSIQNNNNESKFSFDKVIFVCDINNVEHLYKYKYGLNADFEGYIEKFYSFEPFHFSINDAVIDFCSTELSFLDLDKSALNVLSVILVFLASHQHIRIRDLARISQENNSISGIRQRLIKKIEIELFDEENGQLVQSTFFEDWKFTIDFGEFEIIKVIKIISLILGGADKFIKLIDGVISQKEIFQDTFSYNFLPDIFNTLAIISHIAKWKNENPRNIFLTWVLISDEDDYKEYRATGPTIEFLTKKFKLPIKWTEINYYDGGHFFAEALPSEGLQCFNGEEDKKKICNIVTLLTEVSEVLKFLVKEKIL